MKNTFLLTIITALSSPTFANAYDASSKSCPGAAIEVRSDASGQLRNFVYCGHSEYRSTCQQLGSQEWYKKDSLHDQRFIEGLKAASATIVSIADASLLALISFGGILAPAILPTVQGGVNLAYDVHQNVKKLSPAFIEDQNVYVEANCEEFADYASKIGHLLNRID